MLDVVFQDFIFCWNLNLVFTGIWIYIKSAIILKITNSFYVNKYWYELFKYEFGHKTFLVEIFKLLKGNFSNE